VDPWFIVSQSPEKARMIRTAREVNNYKTHWVIEKIKNACLQFRLENGREAVLACLGLAFKPDIDDLRESPAVEVVEALIKDGIQCMVVEPNVESHPHFSLSSLEDAIAKADIAVVLVAHTAFKEVSFSNAHKLDFVGLGV
jgi:UDP-N-acetyl-D-mannosaminuronic acid dehydrogenase